MEDFVDLEAASHPGYREGPARLEAMDMDGVAHEVMYNDPLDDMRFYNNLDTVQDNLEAFNRALYEFASVDPNRILITYHLPITDIDFAIEELHRVVQLGARSCNYLTLRQFLDCRITTMRDMTDCLQPSLRQVLLLLTI